MSRSTRRAIACAIVAVAALVAAGCGSSSTSSSTSTSAGQTDVASVPFTRSVESGLPTSYPKPREAPLTIGLLNPLRATEVLSAMFDAAKARVDQLGGTTVELDANLSPDTQISQFQQLINRRVDAIGIYAIAGPNVLGPLLQRAAKAGIPVIGFDVTPDSPKPVPGFASQVWQQRDQLTYLQVKAAASVLPPGSEVAQIGLALPVPIFQYAAARQRYWAEQFGLKIVDQADSREDTTHGGEQAARGLIAKNPNLRGILGYNDEPAVGAALAARAAGRDVKTFGVTGGELARGSLASDRLSASAAMDASAMGVALADGLYDAAQQVEIPPVVVAGEPRLLTPETVDQVPNWDELLEQHLGSDGR